MKPLRSLFHRRSAKRRARRAYSLAVLFLFLAAMAVLFALTRSAWVEGNYKLSVPSRWFIAAVLIGSLVGCCCGGIVAHSHRRKPATVALGCCAGLLTGAAAAGLLYAGPNAWFYLAGAALLVIVSLFFRMASPGGG